MTTSKSRRTHLRQERRGDLKRIRAYLVNPSSACPDMDRADGLILLMEIDRLTKLVHKGKE